MAENEGTTETTEVETTEEATSATETPEGLGDAGKQAIDRMKAERDAARKEAKAREREIERLKSASLTDQERAVAEAKASGAAEATLNAGKRLAKAEIRAAAASKGLKVTDDDLDDLDLSKFVGEDGEPDPAAIQTRIKRWESLAPDSKRPSGSADQGNRGAAPTQTNAEAFASFLQNQMRTTT